MAGGDPARLAHKPAQSQGVIVLFGAAAAVHRSTGRISAHTVRDPRHGAGRCRLYLRQRLRTGRRSAGPLAATQSFGSATPAMAVWQPVDRLRGTADLCATGLILTAPDGGDG
ncbi:hypothetical protein D3C85_1377920 [compost metagenome]